MLPQPAGCCSPCWALSACSAGSRCAPCLLLAAGARACICQCDAIPDLPLPAWHQSTCALLSPPALQPSSGSTPSPSGQSSWQRRRLQSRAWNPRTAPTPTPRATIGQRMGSAPATRVGAGMPEWRMPRAWGWAGAGAGQAKFLCSHMWAHHSLDWAAVCVSVQPHLLRWLAACASTSCGPGQRHKALVWMGMSAMETHSVG